MKKLTITPKTCEKCALQQRMIAGEFAKILMRRMTPLQIAGALEEWELRRELLGVPVKPTKQEDADL